MIVAKGILSHEPNPPRDTLDGCAMDHSIETTHGIDPLGMTSEDFIASSRRCGVAASAALAEYRAFFRAGVRTADWVAPSRRPISRREVEGATTKFTLQLSGKDSLETESVLIPMPRRDGSVSHTLCVSSQIGCAMGCEFCETAQMGLVRNLSVADIVAQWHSATHEFGIRPKNIVFMGMGEPTDNLDAVIPAIQVLADHDGAAVAVSNISVSTVGNPQGIRLLGELARRPGFRRLNLAVSLNAPNDTIRSQIMPVGKVWPLADLMEAILAWPGRPRAAILIEYVLIPGVNDAPEHCDEVCEYLRDLRCSLNIIPYNPRRDSPWPAPEESTVNAFVERAIANGQFTKRRGTKGRSVFAACGQLGNPEIRNRRRISEPHALNISATRSRGTES